MLKVGVTGNIGSGKTTVCKVFESLGIRVYYADSEAKKFYANPEVIAKVKTLFGNDVFDAEMKVRSAVLAEIVFNDPEKLKQLNAIIHPLVLDDFLAWAIRRREEDYIIYESALLFESGFASHFDHSILVTAPSGVAMQRVIHRDKIAPADYHSRSAHQLDEQKKAGMATFIINNDGRQALIPQVISIHRKITAG